MKLLLRRAPYAKEAYLGLLWGQGDLGRFGLDNLWDEDFQVLGAIGPVYDLKGFAYAPKAKILFSGSSVEACAIIRERLPPGLKMSFLAVGDGGEARVGDWGCAIAGDGGEAHAGAMGKAFVSDYGVAHVGDYGTAKAGAHSIARSGVGGTSSAGNSSVAFSGLGGTSLVENGYAEAGDGGKAFAFGGGEALSGDGGVSFSGRGGVSIVGAEGKASSGVDGTLIFRDSGKTHVVKVGFDGILPNKTYRCWWSIFTGTPRIQPW